MLVRTRCSSMAQWKRAGPITQRSVDRNHFELCSSCFFKFCLVCENVWHIVKACSHLFSPQSYPPLRTLIRGTSFKYFGIIKKISFCFQVALLLETVGACTWTRTPSQPKISWMSAAATTIGPNSVAFAGGTFIDRSTGRFGSASNQVTTYNIITDTWRTLPNMTARSAPASATLNGRIYVFGGIQRKANASHSDPDPTIKLALVESIAVSDHGREGELQWRREPDLPGPRESPSAVSVGTRGIVIAGGFDSGIVNGVFKYEYFNSSYWFDGTTYQRLPDMPFKRSNMALVYEPVSDAVFAFGGGETDPSYATCAYLSVSKQSIGTKDWSPCPPLVNARSWSAAGFVGDAKAGEIVLAGGVDGRFSPTAEVDTLRVGASNWTDAGCDLPSAAGFLSGATTGDGGSFVVVIGDSPVYGAYVYSAH